MNKRIFIILTILSVVFLSIGGTLAAFTTSMTAINITQIKSGNLTMTISGGGNENVSFIPSECTDNNTIKKTIVAKTTNTSGGKVSFSIGLNITALSDTYKKNTVKYALTTNASSCTDGLIANGSFKDKTVNSDLWLIKNDYDDITKSGNDYTKTYYLYIWLDESETEYFDGSISVKLKGTSSNNPSLTTEAVKSIPLYSTLKSRANTTVTINFSKTSEESNTNGIYMTTDTDSGKPVYYYRGNVDNHLIFANFCWRIIRTTETGGIKLIYDGVPTDGQCNNTGDDTTIGKSKFNSADVGYMYGTVEYELSSRYVSVLSGTIVFGNDVTYANGIYTLKDIYTLANVSNWSSEYSTIASKYHYTCFTSSYTCEKVNYAYNMTNTNIEGIVLDSGKNNLDVLNDLLVNSTNENDSIIKIAIDSWYKDNMTDYTSQLEDTVFCDDRSYYDLNTSGFDKDYNNSENYLILGGYKRTVTNKQPSLLCSNANDRFTVNDNNGNGALTYPVGLITVDEVMFAGGSYEQSNNSYFLYNGTYYWTLSSFDFRGVSGFRFLLLNGGKFYGSAGSTYRSIRPVISLKPGTEISSGSGTATDPFIVN